MPDPTPFLFGTIEWINYQSGTTFCYPFESNFWGKKWFTAMHVKIIEYENSVPSWE